MDTAQYVSPTPSPVVPPSVSVQTPQEAPHCCPKHRFGWRKMVGITVVAMILMIFWTWLSSPMIITVTGTGEVNVPATNATISFNVLTTNATVQGTIDAVTTKATNVKNTLLNAGIADADIVQTQITATPVTLGTGYQAEIQMGAKVTNIAKISPLIATLYSNGVSSVSQPVLAADNQNDLQVQAYDDAMKDANTQAAKIAAKNWKLVRKIINVSQTSSGTTTSATSKGDSPNGVFKIAQAVTVSYKMW